MMTFPKYPEIPLLKRRTDILFAKEVVACEKLHGSNFRIGLPSDPSSEILYGSRETVASTPGQKFPLGNAVTWFTSRPELLTGLRKVFKTLYPGKDVTIFGEAYGPGINVKGVKYTEGKEVLFRTFDIMVDQDLVDYDVFVSICDEVGLPRVPEIWRGVPSTEAFDALLEKPSVDAAMNGIEDPANIAEGVVIRSVPLAKNEFGEYLIIKHKSARFSEVAHAPKESVVKGPSAVDDFVATYVTPGRVQNAIGRLRDRGVELSGTMKDTPLLLAEVVLDLGKEQGPELEALGPDAGKQLKGAVSKLVGPIFKVLLASGEV